MDYPVKIRSALLSVSDKSGIVELGRALHAAGVRLISTGGTRAALQAAGLAVTEIAEVTGSPEAFGGRVKTLSFQIGAGLLFDRVKHAEEAAQLGVMPIDLVVANFYPFAKFKDRAASVAELIEHIDVGGPTMVRAAAKNFAHVAVLTDPGQYGGFIEELEREAGHVTQALRAALMRAAFAYTAAYDQMIAQSLGGIDLRYGENPHQSARFFSSPQHNRWKQLGGKELSYNNLVDLDAAIDSAFLCSAPTCAIIKHENPCGLASSERLSDALQLAWSGDPISAFGSVIAVNRPLTLSDVAFFALETSAKKFVEVLAAPAFNAEALAYLGVSKNLRILQIDEFSSAHPEGRMRQLRSGMLVQSQDNVLASKCEFVSATKPTSWDPELADFGMHAARMLKSNAIAIVRRTASGVALLGMGAGQPNRVKSVQLALQQATLNVSAESGDSNTEHFVRTVLGASYLVSDAFFPFRDGVDIALNAGIRTILQPGGSLRDNEVKLACDEHGAVLAITGTRHFRH
jgi:phosphoribosylaminoimidazolecarboxamide formyltransferase / IMP cyclohydrolase